MSTYFVYSHPASIFVKKIDTKKISEKKKNSKFPKYNICNYTCMYGGDACNKKENGIGSYTVYLTTIYISQIDITVM